MNHLTRGAAALAAVGILAGCATTGTHHISRAEEQRARATVVGKLADVPPHTFVLDANDAALLQTGEAQQEQTYALAGPNGTREIVKLYKLPTWKRPYSIQVTSLAVGGLTDPALFYPKLTFLDASFTRTRETQQSDFVYRSVGAQGGIATTVFVNESERNEAYLAIASETREGLREQTSIMQSSGGTAVAIPVGVGIAVWVIPTGGTELPKQLRALAIGPMQIKITPYAPARPL
jgi:hypothetical protein